jgi:Flp pilus assembly protein TadG
VRWRLDRARNESGQALVEFAIVAPLIVMVLLFALWFYELVHVKLKVQEAARYAAWEATAYPLHDYDKGPSELSNLASSMRTSVIADTMQRYMDLDSRSDGLSASNQIFASSWTPPIVVMTNQQEEVIYGGPIVNLVFGLAGTLFDFLSALTYKNQNYVALSMIGLSKVGEVSGGGAMRYRMFGSSAWGFNRSGYVEARVALMLKNEFANRGVGRFILPNKSVFISERHGVLADSWRLDTGESAYGDAIRPGYASSSPYWKQIDRMYLVNSGARGAARTWIGIFRAMMLVSLAFTGSMSMPPNLSNEDFTRAAVVSRGYTDADAGKVDIVQDRGSTRRYDTAPLGQGGGGAGGGAGGGGEQATDFLGEHRKTLDDRGPHFMGCPREMSLGCPSSTLQQDNPLGPYLFRGEGSKTGGGGAP